MNRILGIETSCDETAVAIVNGDGEVLTTEISLVSSQIDVFKEIGGVVPEVAAREHMERLLALLERVVPRDGEGIDAIAVTSGPGLAPALRVGVEVAKMLAWSWKKPLYPVSHLEGHIYSNWLDKESVPAFPALCLLVSGGHTELVLMKGHGDFQKLGETLDDAAGEAFDKVASMLDLPYPGGPAISALAKEGDIKAFDFPRGLLDRDDYNFSFSGLKTSVLYTLRDREGELDDDQFRKNISASFQEAVVDVLAKKTERAANVFKPASLMLTGGVAANESLRERFFELAQRFNIPLFIPDREYTTDNAAMIAAVGYMHVHAGKNSADPKEVVADSNLSFYGT